MREFVGWSAIFTLILLVGQIKVSKVACIVLAALSISLAVIVLAS